MGPFRGPGDKRRTKLGLALEQDAKEILDHVKGEARLPVRRIALPDEIYVKLVLTKARMWKVSLPARFASTRER